MIFYIAMEPMVGIKVIETLQARSFKGKGRTHSIFLTEFTESDLVIKAKWLGVYGFLVKLVSILCANLFQI
jgi:DNA-binding NarL/FixJ family response regulator